MRHKLVLLFVPSVLFALSGEVSAQTPVPLAEDPTKLTIGGYMEGYWQWNFNQPRNGVTNARGFDNRHNSLTLSNVALDAQWESQRLIGRATLQQGATPATYYAAEPALAGGTAANATGPGLWQYIQQAYAGVRLGADRQLTLSAGTYLSPIGPESMAVKDNWNWSRSNGFLGLPFYHTGAKATLALSDKAAATVAVWNGWNSVVDNNRDKSVMAQWTWTDTNLAASILYFGGVERAANSAEGRAWRHLLDGHVTWHATSRLSLLGHLNGGMESNRIGTPRWLYAALYGRAQTADWLWLIARVDGFFEKSDGAQRIFWPVGKVGSGTLTADFRPHPQFSCRVELRRDIAGGALFYDADATVPDSDNQTTLTVGVTSWF